MKKQIICLMIACLSLFAYPLSAGSLEGPKDKTEIPVIPPAMEKKVNEFRKNHPEMFTKKNKDAKAEDSAEANTRHGGGVIYISGGALLLIIILLIILL